MAEREIASFTLLQGHILRLINNLAIKINVAFHLVLRPEEIIFDIRSSDKRKYARFPISGEVIQYRWEEKIPLEDRHVEISLGAETMKATLKSIKKNANTCVKIFHGSEGSFSEQKYYGIFFCNVGSEGYRNIRVERARPALSSLILLPVDRKTPITVLGAKVLGNKLISFADNRDIQICIFPRAIVVGGELKAKAGMATEVIGEVTPEEEKQVFEAFQFSGEGTFKKMVVTQFIQPLRALCALYDGPTSVFYNESDDGYRQLVFVNHVSYHGSAVLFIRPKDLVLT